jgi:hypothetical protein
MANRELILMEEEDGKVLRRFPVGDLNEGQIIALERRLRAQSGEGVLIRDTGARG